FKVNAKGELQNLAHIAGGEDWRFDASQDGKRLLIGASHHAVLCDGAGKALADIPLRFVEPGQKEETVAPVTFVALAPDGSAAAVGAANGRVIMLDANGKQKWAMGGVTAEEYAKWQTALKEWEAGEPQRQQEREAYKAAREKWQADVKAWEATDRKEPKPQEPAAPQHPARPAEPKPDAYIAAAFTNDGKALVAITGQTPGGKAHNHLHFISAADGKLLHSEGGVNGRRGLVRAGDNFLLTDSQARVALFSPAEGKIVKQLSLTYLRSEAPQQPPKPEPASVYALAPLGQGAVVGSEMDFSVRRLQALEGDQAAATVWQYKDMRRIVKFVAPSPKADAVAAAFWGGHLIILDIDKGQPRFSQTLAQDAAAIAWLGDLLVCCLADGRIVALARP
ncbi:MAG: PQQ-like beta-propeller repeat protein, partial [Planctomycetota bacterium]|nr:PQQ-like beta-propeller repeat protein [Planctomycetota bacterium]